MRIKALRLLPPLAFARFGSACEPQPNFELKINKDNPLDFREIDPAESLKVEEDGSASVSSNDERKRKLLTNDSKLKQAELNTMFRVDNLIRPVAPFFELLAIVDNVPKKLEPVTPDLLQRCGIDPSAVQWKVHVENRKVFRRTGDEKDIVTARTGWFSNHNRRWLHGKCPHFTNGKTINFGHVQFVRPSATDDVRSHLRLRFTPAPGKIYGRVRRRPGVPDDTGYVEPIYKEGTWPLFDNEKPGKRKRRSRGGWPRETLPPSLYANTNRPPAAPWLNQDRAVSRGYLDDACDGFIHVRVRGHDELQAKARICVAPPAFIPDSQFVRTLADDLDQIVNGPKADDLKAEEARERALDILRRAYETVRFFNLAVANGNPVDGRPAESFDTMPAEEAFATQRPVRPVMAPASADTTAVLALHQQVFAALSSGAVPWFLQLLRKPEEVGDLTDKGRRKMPALMSGADSYYLALTRRQIKTIEKAAKARRFAPPALTPLPVSSPRLSPRNLAAQLQYRAKGNPPTSRPEMVIANCCPGLEVDFRAVWRRLFVGIELSEWDNYVVKGTATFKGKQIDLKGHRLLRVNGIRVTVDLTGPSPADLVASRKEKSPLDSDRKADAYGQPIVRSDRNPHGVWTMEWSNCLAHVLDALRVNGKRKVKCEFTAEPAADPQPKEAKAVKVTLTVRDFFEPGTAVISERLAEPGELTQGLCSPWQNDLRECSCFYWASSRPDFINTEVGNDGLTHGDYWFARKRTGEYVPDDYADTRLMGYDDLFKEWEKLLQFQVGGKDSMPELLDLPDVSSLPRRREP
jgi:hypothetical protein